MKQIDVLESQQLDRSYFDATKHMEGMNGAFSTKITPEHGIYGVREVLKDNGVIEYLGKTEEGHCYKEYYKDGKMFRRREILGKGYNETTEYDDQGKAYARVVKKLDQNKAAHVSTELEPNITIKKGNFESSTDSQRRLVRAKMTDISLREGKRTGMPDVDKSGYRVNDQRGHLIADIFNGPKGPENLVPQLDKVNLSDMKRLENIIRDLKGNGHTVDYEVKVNYKTPHDRRPSSFEPKITVDGKEYTELPKELQKIYNEASPSTVQKAVTTLGEKFGTAHELGVKNGLVAAGITMAVSSVENISAFLTGDIEAEEMSANIRNDTVKAGALGYGTAVITEKVSEVMSSSSKKVIQKVGDSCLPAAAVSFTVDAYGAVAAYAKGEIDGQEFAYDLGESAASVIGSYTGMFEGAAIGSVAGPLGIIVGSIAGGAIGCVVATEVYASTVELGVQGAEIVAEKAESLAKETTSFVGKYLPEKMNDVKSAFNDYFTEHNLGLKI